MLRKLMKYEFKATGRCILPLYGALLGFALILRILFKGGLDEKISDTFHTLGNIANMICVFAYGFTMAAVFVATFFIIVQRFYKNILGDEGYLMNTLPIKPYLNIINKIIVSLIWTIISCFVAFLSILILFATFDNIGYFFSNLLPALKELYIEFGGLPYLIGFEFCILAIIQLVKSITMLYASISIGHLFSKYKILSSFAAFIALNIISNMINSTLVLTLGKSYLSSFDSPTPGFFQIILLLVMIGEIIYFIAYFFITNYILNHKLNLE
ncbi:ABC transporter permease [uncultured Clostridium sp.]|uniref:ABC transporter permease n=1 Tax=uncultured Clostridium sp. TaxID=59620 RepID=UPI0025F7BFC7|nr:ABC transporter permease [uncultured Clostridium sp.]